MAELPTDPQFVAQLLAGTNPGVVPKQELPPGFARTGEQNPLVESLVGDGPHPDPKYMFQQGMSPHDIAVYLQADRNRQMAEPPRIAKEMALSPIRPVLDAGQYLGDAMRTGGASTTGNETLSHLLDVGSMFGPGSLAKDAMFIGSVGARNLSRLGVKGFDPELSLFRARDLEKSGVNKYDIWHDTHWWRGPDMQWKLEIPDNNLKVRTGAGAGLTSDSPISHPELEATYPGQSRSLRNSVMSGMLPGSGNAEFRAAGESYPHNPEIDIWAENPEQARSFAGHELQHFVQRQEGFSRGGSPREMLPVAQEEYKRFLQQNNNRPPVRTTEGDMTYFHTPETLAKAAYRRLAGEVEARNVEHRMDFNPQQRYSLIPPWESMDTPQDQQVIRLLLKGGPQ
jgi:hypothetical protein